MRAATRRALLLGGAASLLATKALADTVFTNFAFPGTGFPTSRTMPSRIGEIYNVKDFGAVGNASTDDTVAIQAAITAALNLQATSGLTNGATVFFPAGEYITTGPLYATNPGYEASITLAGEGPTASTIKGSFTGYTINKPDDGGVTFKVIRDLYILNQSTSLGSGAIRMDRASNCSIERCQIQGVNGVHLGGTDSAVQTLTSISNASPAVFTMTSHGVRVGQSILLATSGTLPSPLNTSNNYYVIAAGWTTSTFQVSTTPGGAALGTTTNGSGTHTFTPQNNVFCIKIDTCVISSSQASGTAGSYGALVGQVEFYNTSIIGWDVGIAHSNVGLVIHGSRLETNNTGILLGDNIQYTASQPSHSTSIIANSFERDNVALNALNCSAVSVEGNSFTGDVNVSGAGTVVTGISVGTVTAAKFSGNTIGMKVSNACVDLSGSNCVNVSFDSINTTVNSGGTGVQWKLPGATFRAGVTYINCDNPSPTFAFTDLPGQAGVQPGTPVQGMQFNISDGAAGNCADSACTALGTNVTGGGGSLELAVRWNAAKSHWTLFGN